MILADYPVYFKLRVLSDHFFSLNSCKKNSAPHVAAMTERGEVLCDFSVSDLAKELNGGKDCITMHPLDQFFLGVARARLGV